MHALKILYQADIRGMSPEQALRRLVVDDRDRSMLDDCDDVDETGQDDAAVSSSSAGGGSGGGGSGGGGSRRGAKDAAATSSRPGIAQVDEFTRRLVLGVNDHGEQIDGLITRYARRWAISRMPIVDRTVLRMATYELLHEDTSPAVVINEAVELAKALSTDDSGRYVNGVLESIRKSLDREVGGAGGAGGAGRVGGAGAAEGQVRDDDALAGDDTSGVFAGDDAASEPVDADEQSQALED